MFSSHPVIFLLGVISVVVWKVVSPGLAGIARPLVKGAIKGGIALGRQVQEVGHQVSEDFQDLAAEATAELGPAGPTDERATSGKGKAKGA